MIQFRSICFMEYLFLTILLHHFVLLLSDTSCEINNIPRWVLLVCQQSFHQSFSNATCGTNASLAVRLSAFLLRPSFSVQVFSAQEAVLIVKVYRAQMLELSKTFLWSGDVIWPNWGKGALMKRLDKESNFTNEALHQEC